jgi:hypothetical protein
MNLEGTLESKIYQLQDDCGICYEYNLHSSRLIFVGENGELLPESIYEIDDFVDFLSGAKSFEDDYIFFKTANINSNQKIESQLTISSSDNNKLIVEFGDNCDIIIFSRNNEILILNKFLNTGCFSNIGLGHSIMALIKSAAIRLSLNIALSPSDNSVAFYRKERFAKTASHGYWLDLIWQFQNDTQILIDQGLL